jgi:hypothetical protein
LKRWLALPPAAMVAEVPAVAEMAVVRLQLAVCMAAVPGLRAGIPAADEP